MMHFALGSLKSLARGSQSILSYQEYTRSQIRHILIVVQQEGWRVTETASSGFHKVHEVES